MIAVEETVEWCEGISCEVVVVVEICAVVIVVIVVIVL